MHHARRHRAQENHQLRGLLCGVAVQAARVKGARCAKDAYYAIVSHTSHWAARRPCTTTRLGTVSSLRDRSDVGPPFAGQDPAPPLPDPPCACALHTGTREAQRRRAWHT
jgi:hypothetical protein